MYLMIDNYDSFTYNLVALFESCGARIEVIRNDQYRPADDYQGIILSPGPSSPRNAGTTLDYLRQYTGAKPIFGVCLGMQSIAYSLGFPIRQAATIMHGKTERIDVTGESILFRGVPARFTAVRYHSLAVDVDPSLITAVASSDGVTMAIEDHARRLYGVQFHPESIMSECGAAIVHNFMSLSV